MKATKLILWQIVYALPLFIIVGILLNNIVVPGSPRYYLISIVLFTIVVYLSLLTIKKTLLPYYVKKLSLQVGAVYCILGIIEIALAGDYYHIIYAILAFLEIGAFIRLIKGKEFKNADK